MALSITALRIGCHYAECCVLFIVMFNDVMLSVVAPLITSISTLRYLISGKLPGIEKHPSRCQRCPSPRRQRCSGKAIETVLSLANISGLGPVS
jgi:hypothetical protein